MNESSKGKTDVFFKIGSQGKQIQSSLGQATFVVCGKETVELQTQEALEKVLRTDVANELILKSTSDSWFVWTAGDESSNECYTNPSLSLVDGDGAGISSTDEGVRLLDNGDIEITNSKLTQDSRTIQLKVTSKGGVTVLKKIILQAKPTCKPSITPDDATIVLDWIQDGGEIDVYTTFQKEMEIKSNVDTDCTIDQILSFDA